MNQKNIIKFTLDIAMAVLFITFFNKNIISFKFHIISGYVFAVFILIHMFLNKKWIVNISKRLFDKKVNLRTKVSYILSVLLFISIVVIISSGVFMMKAPNYDRLMLWKMMHFGASYLSIALIGIHVGLYWKFVMNMFKKVFKLKGNSNVNKSISSILVILTLLFGVYTMHSQSYFTKVSNTLTYVIKHIEPQDIEQPENNGYQKEYVPFINLATTYGSIISVFAITTYYGDLYIKRNNKNKSLNK